MASTAPIYPRGHIHTLKTTVRTDGRERREIYNLFPSLSRSLHHSSPFSLTFTPRRNFFSSPSSLSLTFSHFHLSRKRFSSFPHPSPASNPPLTPPLFLSLEFLHIRWCGTLQAAPAETTTTRTGPRSLESRLNRKGGGGGGGGGSRKNNVLAHFLKPRPQRERETWGHRTANESEVCRPSQRKEEDGEREREEKK